MYVCILSKIKSAIYKHQLKINDKIHKYISNPLIKETCSTGLETGCKPVLVNMYIISATKTKNIYILMVCFSLSIGSLTGILHGLCSVKWLMDCILTAVVKK